MSILLLLLLRFRFFHVFSRDTVGQPRQEKAAFANFIKRKNNFGSDPDLSEPLKIGVDFHSVPAFQRFFLKKTKPVERFMNKNISGDYIFFTSHLQSGVPLLRKQVLRLKWEGFFSRKKSCQSENKDLAKCAIFLDLIFRIFLERSC